MSLQHASAIGIDAERLAAARLAAARSSSLTEALDAASRALTGDGAAELAPGLTALIRRGEATTNRATSAYSLNQHAPLKCWHHCLQADCTAVPRLTHIIIRLPRTATCSSDWWQLAAKTLLNPHTIVRPSSCWSSSDCGLSHV